MLKQRIEYSNSIKNTQAEMKNIVMETKKNLSGINSRMDEVKNQSNDMEHKKTKNNQSEQQEEKRIQTNKQTNKKPRVGKQSLGQLQEVQHSHHRGARRRRERTRNWKSI